MELALIIGIFFTGFLLIFVEFFFIPGNTVIGLSGIAINAFGIYQVYHVYDATTGSIVLGIFLFIFIGSIVYAAKTKAWQRFSHEEKLTSRIKNMEENEVVKDDTGEAISAIRPFGKAIIKGKTYEVQSMGDFINTGTTLIVVKVTPNKIYVEPVIEKEEGDNKDESELQ